MAELARAAAQSHTMQPTPSEASPKGEAMDEGSDMPPPNALPPFLGHEFGSTGEGRALATNAAEAGAYSRVEEPSLDTYMSGVGSTSQSMLDRDAAASYRRGGGSLTAGTSGFQDSSIFTEFNSATPNFVESSSNSSVALASSSYAHTQPSSGSSSSSSGSSETEGASPAPAPAAKRRDSGEMETMEAAMKSIVEMKSEQTRA